MLLDDWSVHLGLDIIRDVKRLLLFVSQTVGRLFEVNLAPYGSHERNDSKEDERAGLADRAIHHWLDGQRQHEDHGVAGRADKAQSRIDGHLAAIKPCDGARSILEAEKEQENHDQRQQVLIDQDKKSNTEMAQAHGKMTANEKEPPAESAG